MSKIIRPLEPINPGDCGDVEGRRANMVRDDFNGKSFLVCGVLYKTLFMPRMIERFGVMGQTDFFNETFTFDTNMTEGALLSTMLHEALEVICRKFQLDITHRDISALESALFMFFKDNPGFVMALIDYSTRDKKDDEEARISMEIMKFLEEGGLVKKVGKKKKATKKKSRKNTGK